MSRNVGSAWRRMLIGALFGLLWGVGMRAWMRFISTNPEFTWGGTLFIVGATTIAGTLTGLAYWRWQKARGQFWRLLGLSFLPLGTAAGAVMLPTFVLGGIAWGRRRWPVWIRLLLGLIAVALQVVFLVGGINDFATGREAVGVALYAGFLAVETWAFSIMARPLPQNAAPAPDTRSPLAVSDHG